MPSKSKMIVTVGSLLLPVLACGKVGLQKPRSPASSNLQTWQEPDEAFRIGRGFDPDAIEQVRGDCILDPERLLEINWHTAQGIKTTLAETRVTSFESLLQETNLQVNASASSAFYSGKANYTKYEKFHPSEENFTWIFKLTAEMGSQTLHTEKIGLSEFKPEARQLIQQAQAGDNEAKKSFQRMCGTQFVRSARLGGHITEVLEISAKASTLLRQIHADIQATARGGAWRASASASFDATLQRAAQSSMLKREFSQEGGDHIYYDMKPEQVQTTLDSFAKALSQSNARVIAVELVDWETLISFQPNALSDIARRVRLEQLLREIWRYKTKLDLIDSMVYKYENEELEFTSEELEALKQAKVKIEEYLDAVSEAGKNCYIDSSRCAVALPPVVVPLPAPKPVEREQSTMVTDHWMFTVPGKGILSSVSRSGTRSSWMVGYIFSKKINDSESTKLLVDAFEDTCPAVHEIFETTQPITLFSHAGAPIKYRTNIYDSLNANTKDTDFAFGFRKNQNCLTVSIFTQDGHGTSRGFLLNDKSEASNFVEKIAKSVQHR